MFYDLVVEVVYMLLVVNTVIRDLPGDDIVVDRIEIVIVGRGGVALVAGDLLSKEAPIASVALMVKVL